MGYRGRNIAISLLLLGALLTPLWLWMRPPSPGAPASRLVPSSSPTRGAARVAVDKTLMPAIELQKELFTEHYPETTVSLKAEPSGRTLLRLVDRVVGGAVIEGALTRDEQAIIASMHRPVRREPIARDALVFIVNRANPLGSISLPQLQRIFSGNVTAWQQVGGGQGKIVPCVDGDDYRAQATLSTALYGKASRLSAWAAANRSALIERVASDVSAAAVVTLPTYAGILRSPDAGRIKALPLRRSDGDKPVLPSPATLYSGDYPLVSLVCYVYDPHDPTARGFGAWLSKEGQKYFERGDLAPYRQVVRTIILQ